MTWANYDDVLDQLSSAGLLVDRIVTGRVQRCRVEGGDREKRGWYKLTEHRSAGGDFLLVGSFGVWRGADNGAQRIELRKHKVTDEERAALRKRLAEDRRAAEAERKATAARAAERAARVWANLQPDNCDDHEYLKRKHVRAYGLRMSGQRGLAIPMCDGAGRIHGLQIIREPSTRQRKLDKEFWPAGIAKAGRFHLIGVPDWIVLVAEGYATAATLHDATGLPVAVAFDAGNLKPVGEALAKTYPRAKLLFCADDDSFASCLACGTRIDLDQVTGPDCPSCGQPHQRRNTGVTEASAAALATKGHWIAPVWTQPQRAYRTAAWIDKGIKLTDFNDLCEAQGIAAGRHAVGNQLRTQITALSWDPPTARANTTTPAGEGHDALKPIEDVTALLERFSLVYAQSGTVFDHSLHQVVSLSDMRDLCLRREIHRAWMEHPARSVVSVEHVGFDPGGENPKITCNLWGGWPTVPKAGKCERLLELLWFMTGREPEPIRTELYRWLLRWIAYPIQHPGAKLNSSVVCQGPQGTGKNTFWEAVQKIYGRYGRVLDQASVEDKFNDCFSRLLFYIADEVVARSELYHVKNKLKVLISGDQIRINPKNMAAWWEDNHCNGVFLSNEAIPVVLEEDDRRYAVIYTPDKLPKEFYRSVYEEIANGGIAALHDFLLNLDLGDFGKGTEPPWSNAKAELIDQSLDSTSRFFYAWESGDVDGVPYAPALSEQVFEAYRLWSGRINVRPAPMPRLVHTLRHKHKVVAKRARYMTSAGIKGPHGFLLPPLAAPPEGKGEGAWLGDCVDTFGRALKLYRGERKGGGDAE